MWTYGFAFCFALLPEQPCHVRDGSWITAPHPYATEHEAREAMWAHRARIRALPGWSRVGSLGPYLLSGNWTLKDIPPTDIGHAFEDWRKELAGQLPGFPKIESSHGI